MRVLVVALSVLLAGCSHAPDDPPIPTETVTGGQAFLTDPVDEELDAVYDLLAANFTELNGSVVLSVRLRDVHSPVPRLVNVFDILTAEGRQTLYARTVAAPQRPPPSIDYELGRVRDGNMEPIGNICGIHGAAETPPRVMFDLPHNMTGLAGGGTIVGLHTEVHNFENDTLYDAGDAEKAFEVGGGENPYDTCPLIAERARQS